ncbi:aldose epimerase family protein [Kytococcus sp. Marseille-QA3725]
MSPDDAAATPPPHIPDGPPLPEGVELRPSGSGAGELVARTSTCSLRLDLQGAHLLSHVPAGGTDLLWVSPGAVRAPGAAVRGGVPVCAPWFAGGPEGDRSPNHGPARTQTWQLETATVAEDGTVALALTTRAEGVDLRLEIAAGRQLHVDLTLALPQDAGPRRVEAALHSYLAVSAVGDCALDGLDGAGVVDKLTGQVVEQHGLLRPDGAIDRIHRLAGPVRLDDARRSITIESQGAADTVVWSPGGELSDVPAEAWDGFLCVESACIGERADGVDHSIHLEPGGAHTLGVTYTASDAGRAGA